MFLFIIFLKLLIQCKFLLGGYPQMVGETATARAGADKNVLDKIII